MRTSDTPRVDAVAAFADEWPDDVQLVEADFARKIERELDSEKYDHAWALLEVKRLNAELTEARKDSERLDWLEKHAFDVRKPHRRTWTVNYVEHHVSCYSSATNLRAAIDAAREGGR